MQSIASFVAPKSTAAQAASHRAGRQLLMGADYGSRGAFEMKPGEVSRKSSHQRLNKRQTHHQQTRRHGVELRLDPSADHIGERHRQGSAKHEIRNDPQRRQENSKPEQEQSQRKPLDAAQIRRDIGLRGGVHRLEKSLAENSMVNNRAINKPAKPWRAVDLAAPFRGSGWAEEDQVFETQE